MYKYWHSIVLTTALCIEISCVWWIPGEDLFLGFNYVLCINFYSSSNSKLLLRNEYDFSISRALASFEYCVCDACFCLPFVFVLFWIKAVAKAFIILILLCVVSAYSLYLALVLSSSSFFTVSSYFLEFYLWQFSEARVKVGFPWEELPVLSPGDWRHSWPHPPPPLETQLSFWGCLDLRLFQANTCIRSSLWLWVLIGAGVSPLHLAPRLRQVIVLLSSGVS